MLFEIWLQIILFIAVVDISMFALLIYFQLLLYYFIIVFPILYNLHFITILFHIFAYFFIKFIFCLTSWILLKTAYFSIHRHTFEQFCMLYKIMDTFSTLCTLISWILLHVGHTYGLQSNREHIFRWYSQQWFRQDTCYSEEEDDPHSVLGLDFWLVLSEKKNFNR